MTGFICLDKPEGITSFTAVNKLRRICGIKKAGHTGTLDPMATGVLPVMLGGATKFSDFIPTHDKAYEADILLGVTTDTYDVTGNVLSKDDKKIGEDEFRAVLKEFVGETQQLPPMYSAVSKDGVRLYKLARQGISVEREKRNINIYSAEVISVSPEDGIFTVAVSCSAGTYIRSLANDIGEKLGCGAVLKRLRRTSANGFSLADSVTLEELQKLKDEGRLHEAVKSVDSLFTEYGALTVSEAQAKRFMNGGALLKNRIRDLNGEGLFRVYSPEKKFLGLGSVKSEDDEMKIAKLLIE